MQLEKHKLSFWIKALIYFCYCTTHYLSSILLFNISMIGVFTCSGYISIVPDLTLGLYL